MNYSGTDHAEDDAQQDPDQERPPPSRLFRAHRRHFNLLYLLYLHWLLWCLPVGLLQFLELLVIPLGFLLQSLVLVFEF